MLRDLSGTDRVGTTLLGLRKAAVRLGFSCRAVKGPYEALAKLPLPAIAHAKTAQGFGHYLVLHRVTASGVVIADPGQGIVHLARAEFEQQWTGNLLLLQPARALDPTTTGGAPPSPVRRFAHLLGLYRPLLVEAFLCALLMTVLGIASSYFLQHLVDSVLVRSDRPLLHALGLGMLLVVVFRALFGALRQYLLAHVGRQASLALVADYTRHILYLPLRFFEMRRVGEILSRVQDAAKVRDAISGVTLTAIVDGTMVLITLTVLWLYDTRLAAVATMFVPVLMLSVIAHHPAARRRARAAMEQSAELAAHLNENVSGVETVKALGQEAARAEGDEQRLVRVVQSAFALQKLNVSASTAASLVTGVAGIVVLWYGGVRVMDGAMSIGELIFFNSLLGYLLSPLERIASVNLQIQDALVAVDRLYQVMDLDLEQPTDVRRAELGALREGIELKGVSFQYGSRVKVLDQIDLAIPAGKTVAIIGESGSGKTTLLKLLMRFHDPTEGTLVFDNIDARDLDTPSVRARIGLVSQEPFIFTGTIRDNIAMSRPDAPLEEVMSAALAAGLGDVIAKLPQRFDTMIGERGTNLSGGQRQRLAIARALLATPEVLIFDEATSHLDSATERAIQDSLKTALAGKTVVIVAHRLSTVRDADIIYVLDSGKIAERGSHAELYAANGKYTALVRAQHLGDAAVPTAPAEVAAAPPIRALQLVAQLQATNPDVLSRLHALAANPAAYRATLARRAMMTGLSAAELTAAIAASPAGAVQLSSTAASVVASGPGAKTIIASPQLAPEALPSLANHRRVRVTVPAPAFASIPKLPPLSVHTLAARARSTQYGRSTEVMPGTEAPADGTSATGLDDADTALTAAGSSALDSEVTGTWTSIEHGGRYAQ